MTEEQTSLEEVLENDFMIEKEKKLQENLGDLKTEFETIAKEIYPIIQSLQADPIKMQELKDLDFTREEDYETASSILGVSVDFMKRYVELSAEIAEKVAGVMNNEELDRSWEEFLEEGVVTRVDGNSFNPDEIEEPTLVFYSATWCNPCKIRKPNLEKLVPFFERAKLLFTEDEELAQGEGVQGYPSFIAYFPNGTKVKTIIPMEIKDIWSTMNNLFVLGQGFEGKGVLICTEEECKIEPV